MGGGMSSGPDKPVKGVAAVGPLRALRSPAVKRVTLLTQFPPPRPLFLLQTHLLFNDLLVEVDGLSHLNITLEGRAAF